MGNAKPAAAAPPVPPKSASKAKKPTLVKYYLIAFNIVSALGWTYILVLTLIHLFNLDGSAPGTAGTSTKTASSTLTRFLSSLPFFKSTGIISNASIEDRIPLLLRPLYRRSTSTYARVGTPTAIVQSLAALEVVHVLLGLVRSPLQTTAAQVASRLFLVWGIVEQFEGVRSNPIYTSMILSWSLTEVIRYSFYAATLLGYEPYPLLYLRYTTFYLLYPTGAGSEASLIYATLPNSSPLPGWQSWLFGMWKPTDYVRALLFLIWWPGLYIMYTYMIAQRRKVLGNGARTLGKGPKAN
ncbi:putative catalyzes the third of the four reactions of the long- chain fatty acids elongation cycle [Lyophyllum shimeji]|uniref:Very-long-chain (3R)-3-hydroxyacyl-CoA dehydratase n=1 Tax=Lyophyllum shimeji TaxID=47721 RepID=A0A9P3UJM2_LYOSH|nr:putative catalyzes the third of the four reactions of the long- chain fatty acids elongation cycle [Lyophyllum shimeji]